MNNDGGRLNFSAGIDNSQLRADAEESKKLLQGITDVAVEGGNTMDSAFSKLAESIVLQQKVIKELEQSYSELNSQIKAMEPGDAQNQLIQQAAAVKQELDAEKQGLVALRAEFKSLQSITGSASTSLEQIRAALSQIGDACYEQEEVIAALEAQYKQLSTQAGNAWTAGRNEEYRAISEQVSALQGEITMRKRLLSELREQSNALEEQATAIEKEVNWARELANSHVSLNTQLREVREEMQRMELAGDTTSEAYRKLQERLKTLSSAISNVQAQQNKFRSSTQMFDGLLSGISGVAGAFSAAQGAMALFNSENENLQKIMLKVQSLMAITIGLKQTQALLDKNGAFQLTTLNSLREWWNKILAAGTAAQTANTVATKTGTTANIGLAGAFRMVGAAIKSIPGFGWIAAAITALVAVISKFVSKANEAKKAAQEFYSSLADNAYKPIAKIEELSLKWNALGDDLNAKKKFINENAAAFDELGVAVNDVADAQNLLVTNKEAFVQAQIEKAKALLYYQQAQDKVKELVETQQKYEATPATKGVYVSSGMGWGHWVEEANPEKAELEQKLTQLNEDIKELYNNAAAADSESLKKLEEAGIEAIGSYEEGTLGALQQAIQRKQESLKYLTNKEDYQAAMKEIEELQRQVEAITGKSSTSSSTKSSTSNDQFAERNLKIAEYAKSVQEAQAQAELDIRQQRINLMEESFEKTMAQLDLNYDKLIAENEKREQEMIEALADKMVLEWKNVNPTATKEQEIAYRTSLNLTTDDLTPEQQAMLQEYADIAREIREQGNKEALETMLADVLTYQQQRQKIEEEYAQKRNKLYETDESGNYVVDENGNRTLREGVTQGNIDELNYQLEEALKAVDEQFAQREATYIAWCNQIASYTLEQLEQTLKDAKAELEALEQSGEYSDSQLAVAKAKVNTAQSKYEQAQAEADVSPDKRSIEEWKDLYDVINECAEEFENLGDTVDGTVGEILSAVGSVMSSTTQIINGITKLVSTTATGIKSTTDTTTTALSTMEKASVILTIITTAIQIAMKIIDLLDNDDYEDRMESLQNRLSELQWQAENVDVLRLQQSMGTAFDNVKDILKETTAEMLNVELAAGNVAEVVKMAYSSLSSNTDLVTASAEKLVKAYGNVSYAITNAVGEAKFDAKDELENYAKQLIVLQEQYETEMAEQAKEKDPDYSAAEEYKQQIEETAYEMANLLNSAVEEIIGGSVSDIANELADAFIDAFQAGEDAAEAWGEAVEDIVADIVKSMLVTAILEEPLAALFDKYKEQWYDTDTGEFLGADAVLGSMEGFSDDLNELYGDFEEVWDALPDELAELLGVSSSRSASSSGIATASQESIDELNGRATAIQGHTYTISENSKILVANTNLILSSVLNIEGNTDGLSSRMANVEAAMLAMRNDISDIALKGVKIRS